MYLDGRGRGTGEERNAHPSFHPFIHSFIHSFHPIHPTAPIVYIRDISDRPSDRDIKPLQLKTDRQFRY